MKLFFTLLKERVADNYRSKGGLVGLTSFLLVALAAILPPFPIMEWLGIEPYTPMRLVVPLIWLAYLAPGASKLNLDHLRPTDAIRLVFWPLSKT